MMPGKFPHPARASALMMFQTRGDCRFEHMQGLAHPSAPSGKRAAWTPEQAKGATAGQVDLPP